MFITQKWILTEFLRYRLTDPRARSEETQTETFTATAGQTTFQLTPTSGNIQCITAVTLDSVASKKLRDYYTDLELGQIVFRTALTVGQIVAVTYKYGSTNWIYPDKPNTELSSTSFPRMNLMIIPAGGKRLGSYDSQINYTSRVQIDIWCKEKSTTNIFTIEGHKYTGEKLTEYLAAQVQTAFLNYEDDLFPILYDYEPIGPPADMPFNDEYQAHHKTVEFMISGIDIHSIS